MARLEKMLRFSRTAIRVSFKLCVGLSFSIPFFENLHEFFDDSFLLVFFFRFLFSSRSPSTSRSWSMLCCPNVYSFQRYTTVALALLLESSRAHLFKHISQNTEQIYKHHQTSFINIKRKGKLRKKRSMKHTYTEQEWEKERDVE